MAQQPTQIKPQKYIDSPLSDDFSTPEPSAPPLEEIDTGPRLSSPSFEFTYIHTGNYPDSFATPPENISTGGIDCEAWLAQANRLREKHGVTNLEVIENSKKLSIKELRKTLYNNMISNNNKASYKILKKADKEGYLPKLWEQKGAKTELNEYMGGIICNAFIAAKKEKKQIPIEYPESKTTMHYHRPPFFNLQNAYLSNINIENFFLNNVNFTNADLSCAQAKNAFFNFENFVKSKSLRGLKINIRVIFNNAKPNDSLYRGNLFSPEHKDIIDILGNKIVQDYIHYFKNPTTTIEDIKNSLKELYDTLPRHSFVRDKDHDPETKNNSLSNSFSNFFKDTTPHQKIKLAAVEEIKNKESLQAQHNFFQSVANAYDGSH